MKHSDSVVLVHPQAYFRNSEHGWRHAGTAHWQVLCSTGHDTDCWCIAELRAEGDSTGPYRNIAPKQLPLGGHTGHPGELHIPRKKLPQ